MENTLKDVLESMKKPTLKLQLNPVEDASPALRSYVGGKPFMEKEDKYPCCKNCNQSMDFIFQLYIPKGKDFYLYSFYFCDHCDPLAFPNGYAFIIHKNPSLANKKQRVKRNQKINYLEFEFHPTWSLPEWDVLQTLHPDIAYQLSQEYKEDAWVIYENTKDSMVGTIFMEPFSFFGGYPQFLSDPTFPTCPSCKKKMKLWMQFDSFEDFGITWANSMGCLYLFHCEEHPDKETFQATVQ